MRRDEKRVETRIDLYGEEEDVTGINKGASESEVTVEGVPFTGIDRAVLQLNQSVEIIFKMPSDEHP